MVLVIDYGAGNIASIRNSLQQLGHTFQVQSQMQNENQFRSLILPGVGDGSYMMQRLHELNLVEPIKQWIQKGKAVLGICAGAEVLLSHTEEGDVACLDVIAGVCRRFQLGGAAGAAAGSGSAAVAESAAVGSAAGAAGARYKIPHMGWNSVCIRQEHEKLFEGIRTESDFYFVHSYFLEVENKEDSIAETTYKDSFTSVIGKDAVFGVQFHPEKSGKDGLRMLDNFLRHY